MDRILQAAGVEPALETPAGVEARWRATDDGPAALIVINTPARRKPFRYPGPPARHLSGHIAGGELTLEPYGVAVLSPLDEAG